MSVYLERDLSQIHYIGDKARHPIKLDLKDGTIACIVGPNGSGKSTLLQCIMNKHIRPNSITIIDGKSILNYETLRNELILDYGMFYMQQESVEIPGLKIGYFLRKYMQLFSKTELDFLQFNVKIKDILTKVDMPYSYLNKDLNVGLSGGEKKKLECVQMLIAQPRIVLLDEIDSGLDIDVKKLVAKTISELKSKGTIFIIVSHDMDFMQSLDVDEIHIIVDGHFAKSGNKDILDEIKEKGFSNLIGQY